MAQVRDGSLGELRAALPPNLRGAVLASVLRAFRDACPRVRLDVREAPTAEQARALEDGSLDVGVILHPLEAALETGPLLEKPLGALVPAGSELGRGDQLDLGDLGGRTLVLFARRTAPAAFDALLTTCRAYGCVPRDVHEAPRPDFALGLVLAGDAIALAEQPHEAVDGVAWRPLAGRPLTLALSTAWRAGAGTGAIGAYTEAAVTALCGEAGWQYAAGPPPAATFAPRPSSGPLS